MMSKCKPSLIFHSIYTSQASLPSPHSPTPRSVYIDNLHSLLQPKHIHICDTIIGMNNTNKNRNKYLELNIYIS